MEFSQEDNKDLVEIVEAVGKAAMSFHTGQITPKEREVKTTYIDSLIRTYIDLYRNDNNNEMPPKSLFGEAIDWYVNKTFGDYPPSLSGTVHAMKGIMKRLVFNPLTSCKRELGNGFYKKGPNAALV